MTPKTGFNKVKEIKLDIIGKFKINKFNGNIYQQIEVIDFNVEKYSEKVVNKTIIEEVEDIDIDW